ENQALQRRVDGRAGEDGEDLELHDGSVAESGPGGEPTRWMLGTGFDDMLRKSVLRFSLRETPCFSWIALHGRPYDSGLNSSAFRDSGCVFPDSASSRQHRGVHARR